jgi:hypothetical protein
MSACLALTSLAVCSRLEVCPLGKFPENWLVFRLQALAFLIPRLMYDHG